MTLACGELPGLGWFWGLEVRGFKNFRLLQKSQDREAWLNCAPAVFALAEQVLRTVPVHRSSYEKALSQTRGQHRQETKVPCALHTSSTISQVCLLYGDGMILPVCL